MCEINPLTGAQLDPLPIPSLVIAMSARTGSSQLCSILGQLGFFAEPHEIFNPEGPVQWLVAHHGISDIRRYLSILAGTHERFCFKVAASHWAPYAPQHHRLFPLASYVYLERVDLGAQALSLARAVATGVWHAPADSSASTPKGKIEVPPDSIARCRGHLERERKYWNEFFLAEGIQPLRITYESLVADPARVTRAICDFAGLPIGSRCIPAGRYRKLG